MIVADICNGFYSILLKVVIVDDETTRGGQKLIQSKAESASKLGLRRVEKYGIGTVAAKGAFTFNVDMVEGGRGFPNVYAST